MIFKVAVVLGNLTVQALKCGRSQLVDSGRIMTVCGSIAVLAYVPLKCTVAEGFKVTRKQAADFCA